MNLTEHELSQNWISQFSEDDRKTAELLLRSLRLVSFGEVEASIRGELEKLIPHFKGKVALFPASKQVRKPKLKGIRNWLAWKFPSLMNLMGEGAKKWRRQYGSEDRFGYMLRNLEKEYPRQFALTPTIKSMRDEKMKEIIVVDDLIGSGQRISIFWKHFANSSIRSWLSSGHCRLWVVVYSANQTGIANVLRALKQLNPSRIHVCLREDRNHIIRSNLLKELGGKYGPRQDGSNSIYGYKGSLSYVIFQHGCPNNTPPMLWKKSGTWRPLFPDKSVPVELFPCFEQSIDSEFYNERLRRAKQARLALKLEERIKSKKISEVQRNLIVVIGLLAKGLSENKLAANMMVTQTKINEILAKGKLLGLIDAAFKVTSLGFDLLDRTRWEKSRAETKRVIGVAEAIKFYYP